MVVAGVIVAFLTFAAFICRDERQRQLFLALLAQCLVVLAADNGPPCAGLQVAAGRAAYVSRLFRVVVQFLEALAIMRLMQFLGGFFGESSKRQFQTGL